MPMLKQAVLNLGFHAGVFRVVQFARRRQAVILCFHRFWDGREGDPRGSHIRRFAECMAYLSRHYRVMSLADLTAALRQGRLPTNAAAVTIDDGYHEAFSLAVPVLRKYAIPATLFVVSKFVDGQLWLWPDRLRFVFQHAPYGPTLFWHGGAMGYFNIRSEADRGRVEARWCEYAKTIEDSEREDLLHSIAEACRIVIPVSTPREYRSMAWTQLRMLAGEGFDVGAHSMTHPILSRVNPRQLQDEIGLCKEQIEGHLGFRVKHFAYPNGRRVDYTPECVQVVSRAGYQAAVTTVRGGNTPGTPIFELRRLNERAEDLAYFAQSVSGFELLKSRFRYSWRPHNGVTR